MVVHVKTTIERQYIQSIIGIGLSEEFEESTVNKQEIEVNRWWGIGRSKF